MSRLKGDGGMKAVRDSEEEDEDGSEEEEGGWGLGQEEGVKTFEGNREECKLVLVVRTDLGMGKGVDLSSFFLYFLGEILIRPSEIVEFISRDSFTPHVQPPQIIQPH